MWAVVSLMQVYAMPTLSDLRRQASMKPQDALQVIDSLQEKAVYPTYKLDYLRSCSYFTMSMFGKSLECAKKAYRSVELKTDSSLYRQVFMLLAESAVFSYSLDDATYYIQKGKEYADESKDEVLLANMLLSEGDLYRRLEMKNRAYDCVLRAINLLSEGKQVDAYHLSHAYGFLMMYYINDGKYADAWQAGQKRSRALKDLKKPLRLDNQKGFLYSKMAYLAYRLGKTAMADEYYTLFQETGFSKTYVGQLEINDYLLVTNKYEQVIRNAKAYVQEMDKRDTLNLSYVRLLQQACLAYEAVGDYRSAYRLAKRRLMIQQSMRQNNERNYLLETADLLNSLKTKDRLEKTESMLRNQRAFLFSSLSISLLLVFCIGGVIWKNRIIHHKNKKMAYLILELERQKRLVEKNEMLVKTEKSNQEDKESIQETALSSPGPEVASRKAPQGSVALSGKEMFDIFDRKVRREKLYLNYQLGRDDYAHIMGSDKNRFAAVLKEYGGMNLSTYLNNLRLEYSIEMFRLHPDWSINEIASQSALPNISTFYRLFKEKYGMSPNVFRQQI